MSDQKILEKILSLGATHAAIMNRDGIVVNRMFREICEKNACGMFNRCWVCPPDVGDIDDLMGRLAPYRRAVLFQTISDLEDSFDIEGMQVAGERHAQLCLRVKREVGFPGPYLVLGGGGCHLCETCAKRENLPCRRPDDATPGMETYGIDVYNTACHAGLKYVNGQNTVTYFGIALY